MADDVPYFFTFNGMMDVYLTRYSNRGLLGSTKKTGMCDDCINNFDALHGAEECKSLLEPRANYDHDHLCIQVLDPFLLAICNELSRNVQMFYWGTTPTTRKEKFSQCWTDFFKFVGQVSRNLEVALSDADRLSGFRNNPQIMNDLVELDTEENGDVLRHVLMEPNISVDAMQRAIFGIKKNVNVFLPKTMCIMNVQEALQQTTNLHIVKHQLTRVLDKEVRIDVKVSDFDLDFDLGVDVDLYLGLYEDRNVMHVNVRAAAKIAHAKIRMTGQSDDKVVFQMTDMSEQTGSFTSTRLDYVVYGYNAHVDKLIEKIAPSEYMLYLTSRRTDLVKTDDLNYMITDDYDMVCGTIRDPPAEGLTTDEIDSAALDLFLVFASLRRDEKTLQMVLDIATFKRIDIGCALYHFIACDKKVRMVRRTTHGERSFLYFTSPYLCKVSSERNVLELYNSLLDSLGVTVGEYRLDRGTAEEIDAKIKDLIDAGKIEHLSEWTCPEPMDGSVFLKFATLIDRLNADENVAMVMLYHTQHLQTALRHFYDLTTILGTDRMSHFKLRAFDKDVEQSQAANTYRAYHSAVEIINNLGDIVVTDQCDILKSASKIKNVAQISQIFTTGAIIKYLEVDSTKLYIILKMPADDYGLPFSRDSDLETFVDPARRDNLYRTKRFKYRHELDHADKLCRIASGYDETEVYQAGFAWNEYVRLFMCWHVTTRIKSNLTYVQTAVDFIRCMNQYPMAITAIVWISTQSDVLPLMKSETNNRSRPYDKRVRVAFENHMEVRYDQIYVPVYCGEVYCDHTANVLSQDPSEYKRMGDVKVKLCVVAYSNVNADIFGLFMIGVIHAKLKARDVENEYGTFLLALYEYAQYVDPIEGKIIVVLRKKHAMLVSQQFKNTKFGVNIFIQDNKTLCTLSVLMCQLTRFYSNYGINDNVIDRYRVMCRKRTLHKIPIKIDNEEWNVNMDIPLSNEWQRE
jgi:hypothetical protein